MPARSMVRVLPTLLALGALGFPLSHSRAGTTDLVGAYHQPRLVPLGPTVFDPIGRRLLCFGARSSDLFASHVSELPLTPGSTWRRLRTVGAGPSAAPAIAGRRIAFDSARNRLLLFGGSFEYDTGYGTRLGSLGECWALSLGSTPTWSQLPSGPQRDQHLFVADPARDRMLVFGGADWGQPDDLVYSRDLWQLDLARDSWSRLEPTIAAPEVSPPTLDRPLGVIDDARNEMLVTSGADPDRSHDTWTLTLAGTPQWRRLSPSNATTTDGFGGAVFDAAADRMLCFGGDGNAWALSGGASASWSNAGESWVIAFAGWDASHRRAYAHAGGPTYAYDAESGANSVVAPGVVAEWVPPSTASNGLSVDLTDGSMISFGGLVDVGPDLRAQMTNHVFAFGGGSDAWRDLTPSAGGAPRGRIGAGWTHDPGRRRMVLFGGVSQDPACDTGNPNCPNEGIPMNDVWLFTSGDPPQWASASPTGVSPTPGSVRASAFDTAGDRALFLGGPAGDELWALAFGSNSAPVWALLPIGGAPEAGLDIRQVTWDNARRRFVVLRSDGTAGTISVGSQAAWAPLPIAGTPPPTPFVAEPQWHYDSTHDRLILWFGASGSTAFRAWVVDLNAPEWIEVQVPGDSPNTPNRARGIYDPVHDRTLMWGGTGDRRLWILRGDRATGVLASLISADAVPGRVQVTWLLSPETGGHVRIERSRAGEGWLAWGEAETDASGRVRIEDFDVVAGGRYGYRLRFGSGIAAEAWISVPLQARAHLEGARPNPANGLVTIAFALAGAGPARLDLLDVQGRVVSAREVGALGAGAHVLSMSTERPLAAGVYLARLRHGAGVEFARVLVVR